MRSIIKFFLIVTGIIAFISSCKKVDDLPLYSTGTKLTIAASATLIAPLAADSDKSALTVSWTNPKYATGAANVKYIIEIDSAGKDFSNPYITKTVAGGDVLSSSFTGKDLNKVLVNRGYAFNVPVSLDVRVSSSYTNNNDKYTSDVIRIKFTPYKVPPKVPVPTSGRLFLVGDATVGGWNNPVPVPSQEFAKIDETTWGGIFQITGGNQYLMLPVNGDWSHKFAVANNSVAGISAGGDFGFDLSDNFKAPATSGLYKIIVDFQAGKFTVTPYSGVLPTNLYIVGDATTGGWNNPVPVPSQQLTRINSSVWEVTLPLVGGKQYLLLPLNGDWGHKFAVANNGLAGLSAGGSFGYDLNDNFPGPATSGTYKISVNFVTGKFTVQ